jgi:hypothetical protein
MMRGAALLVAAVMLVAGSAACGRTNSDDASAKPPSDASSLDAMALDANLGDGEAAETDSYTGADQGTSADSALDTSPSTDAAEVGPDGSDDASRSNAGDASDTGDASGAADASDAADESDAGDASGAAPQRLSCDECDRGEQQCGPLPQVCTYNDAGVPLSCASPGQTIWTCLVGDAGCAVWAKGLACRPDVPCCVPCMYLLNCPLGSLGDPCEQDTDCAFDACDAFSHQCVSDQCGDRRQDGQESDVDCGGLFCNACTVGRRCQGNFDCQSGHLCGSSHRCE